MPHPAKREKIWPDFFRKIDTARVGWAQRALSRHWCWGEKRRTKTIGFRAPILGLIWVGT